MRKWNPAAAHCFCVSRGEKRRCKRKFSVNNRVESNTGVRAVNHQAGVAVSNYFFIAGTTSWTLHMRKCLSLASKIKQDTTWWTCPGCYAAITFWPFRNSCCFTLHSLIPDSICPQNVAYSWQWLVSDVHLCSGLTLYVLNIQLQKRVCKQA